MRRNGVFLLYDISLSIPKEIYTKEVVLKAAYIFIEKAYIHIGVDNTHWNIQMKIKPGITGISLGDFENELIAETVRLSVYRRTHILRELLLGRAMSTSIIEDNNSLERVAAAQQDTTDMELQGILQDWFEKNGK